MQNWLDDLDLKLLEFRDQYGRTYYQGFKTGKLNTEYLREISEQQSSLLATPGILEKAEQILTTSEDISSEKANAARKASLLIRLLKREGVEKSPLLVELKSRIQLKEIAFVPSFGADKHGYANRRDILSLCEDRTLRREAFFSMRPLLESIESTCHDLIGVANELSIESGYLNYFDFVLSQDDLNSDQLNIDMENALLATEKPYRAFLDFCRHEIVPGKLDLFDIPFAQAKLLKETDRLFSSRDSISDLKGTLDTLSIDLDGLPISMEVVDSPNAGTCFVLGPDDVRLILGSEAGYFGHYVAFHEFGHALHYCRQPDSVLLRDNGICLETMADFFAELLTDPEWLSGFCSMTSQEIRNHLRAKKLVDSYRIRTMIRDTIFEYEIFSNQVKSFASTWSSLNKEILGIASEEAIWSPFSIYRPAYIKNYVYSNFLSRMLTGVSKKSRLQADSSKAMLSLFENIVEHGNMVSFKERLTSAGIDSIELKADSSL